MKMEKIKPIPKYIVKLIKKRDLKRYPEPKGVTRFYSYLTKNDGELMVRECVFRDKISRPLTCKMLDASREYWKSHGITDWGIVVDKAKGGDFDE